MLEPIAGHLAPGGLVVFGELHGTCEAPAFVALAAEHAAAAGPVTVALEIPDELQPAIDAFVASGDRAALVATPSLFWSWRDGRSGEALIALLDRVRALRDATVLCFDGAWDSDEARDAGMARAILSAIARRHAAWLVVCGNLHARTGSPRWMGWHLRARHPELVALDIAYDGGCAWTFGDRGPGLTEFARARGDARRGVVLFDRRGDRGFDGEYHVGPLTPSLPLALG